MYDMDLIITLFLVNALRGQPLVVAPVLEQRAEVRAEYLCQTNQWSHEGWIGSFEGLSYGYAGENLAKDFKSDEIAMIMAWFLSPSHWANIKNPHYKYTGLAEGKCGIVVELFSDKI